MSPFPSVSTPIGIITTINITPTYWHLPSLLSHTDTWLDNMRLRKKHASDKSPWWSFVFRIKKEKKTTCEHFINGAYLFSPLQQFKHGSELLTIWDYGDRLVLTLLLGIIKPVFKHIISPLCLHLQGPSGVKKTITRVRDALKNMPYRYSLRLDVKGYYASIDHAILLQQLEKSFADKRLLNYFNAIVTACIDDGGNLISPKKGIPRRSSLSPFFGALYLDPLDRAFENRKGVFYVRYMDDIIILTNSKRQYVQAKKSMYAILKTLKLTLSPSKTAMGLLSKGFHFLGVQFSASQNADNKSSVEATGIHLAFFRKRVICLFSRRLEHRNATYTLVCE